MISFGPVPSRRLGISLGINNIPTPKICSYSCIYCQVGVTKKHNIILQQFYEPEVIFKKVKKNLDSLDKDNKPDYLTFVANGEPTLDINLGESIERLKKFGIPIAVITNASLLNATEVRNNLCKADWVSLKVDSADEKVWRAINRPHILLDFNTYKENLFLFAKEYRGSLNTETMLVKDVNDNALQIQDTADLIKQIKPTTSYISIPTRPPALNWVNKPDEESLNQAYQIYLNAGINPEMILGYEGSNMGYTGNIIKDIVNICSVHPIREDAMQQLLIKDNADSGIVDYLINNHSIRKVEYNSTVYYIRQFQK